MNKQGVGRVCGQAIKIPVLPTYPPVLTHKELAFGLSRFACQTAI